MLIEVTAKSSEMGAFHKYKIELNTNLTHSLWIKEVYKQVYSLKDPNKEWKNYLEQTQNL